jgi:hypothetical protein
MNGQRHLVPVFFVLLSWLWLFVAAAVSCEPNPGAWSFVRNRHGCSFAFSSLSGSQLASGKRVLQSLALFFLLLILYDQASRLAQDVLFFIIDG